MWGRMAQVVRVTRWTSTGSRRSVSMRASTPHSVNRSRKSRGRRDRANLLRNGLRLLSAASLAKLFVAAAALHRFSFRRRRSVSVSTPRSSVSLTSSSMPCSAFLSQMASCERAADDRRWPPDRGRFLRRRPRAGALLRAAARPDRAFDAGGDGRSESGPRSARSWAAGNRRSSGQASGRRDHADGHGFQGRAQDFADVGDDMHGQRGQHVGRDVVEVGFVALRQVHLGEAGPLGGE